MKANELRINNLVTITDENKKVLKISSNNYVFKVRSIGQTGVTLFIDDFYTGFSIGDIQPIPITEERLVKMGFEKDGNNHYTHIGGRFDLVVTWDTIDKCFYTELRPLEGNSLQIDYEYIHQLQNLFYYLTGKELTPDA